MNQKGVSVLISGARWAYLTFITQKGVTFLSTMILARFLTPEAFGVMGMALLIIAYSEAISDSGIGSAMVQQQGDAHTLAKVAFLLSFSLGVLMTALVFFSAPLVAEMFDEPRLVNIMRILAPVFLLSTLSSVQDSWLKKHFLFSKRVLPQIVSVVVKAVVSIGLAFSGAGVWSLVFGQISSVLAKSGALRIVTKLPVGFKYERRISAEMFSFGLQLSLISLLGIFVASLDRLIVGHRLPTEMLGYYTIGVIFPPLAVIGVCNAVQQVVFPAFSRMQRTPRVLRKAYLLSLRYVAVLTFPLAVGLAVVSFDFVEVAYGERWLLSAPVMVFSSLASLVLSLRYTAGSVFKSTRRTRLLTGLIALQSLIALPLIVAVAHLGIVAVAGVALGVEVVMLVITLAFVARQLEFGAGAFLRQLLPAVTASLAMVLACKMVGEVFDDSSAILRLIIMIVTGVMIYTPIIGALDPTTLRGILGRLRGNALKGV